MNFERHLIDQALAHPATQPLDIIKQCYQAAYGAEHLLADMDRARNYMEREYTSVTPDAKTPLYEAISPQVCRVNLAAWKQRNLPLEWLFRMFAATASISVDRQQATHQFLSYLDTADTLIQSFRLPIAFSATQWTETLSTYKQSEMTAVHHSDAYRQAEHPAYRILRRDFVRLLPILEAVADHIKDTAQSMDSTRCAQPPRPCIIAIDGRAASGKTTMADQLSQILGGNVVRMDDFFLPPNLRTQERFQTPGGNVHYERFAEEILPRLRDSEPFSYRKFDCHVMDYNGKRQIDSSPIRIVEGSYSHHPALEDYADIKVFSHVDPDKQMDRILHRNGPQMARMFKERWIPMEENYIHAYRIDTSSQIVIDSTDLF